MLFRWRTVVDRATNGDAVWEELPAGLVCAHLRGLGNKIQFFDDGRCGAWFRDVWHETPDDLAAALALVADEVRGPSRGSADIIRAVSVGDDLADFEDFERQRVMLNQLCAEARNTSKGER